MQTIKTKTIKYISQIKVHNDHLNNINKIGKYKKLNEIEKQKKLNMTKHKTDMNITKIEKYKKKLNSASTAEYKTKMNITEKLSSIFTKEH